MSGWAQRKNKLKKKTIVEEDEVRVYKPLVNRQGNRTHFKNGGSLGEEKGSIALGGRAAEPGASCCLFRQGKTLQRHRGD